MHSFSNTQIYTCISILYGNILKMKWQKKMSWKGHHIPKILFASEILTDRFGPDKTNHVVVAPENFAVTTAACEPIVILHGFSKQIYSTISEYEVGGKKKKHAAQKRNPNVLLKSPFDLNTRKIL